MRRAVMAVMAAGAAALAFAGPAVAGGPPVTATGPYSMPAATDNVTFVRQAGGNLFFHEVATLTYSGDVTGSATDVDDFVVHADGSLQGAGQETCSACTFGGSASGSYVAHFTFQGSGDDYAGTLWFQHSGGGLSGLHGGGSFAGTVSGQGGTYSYKYLFAP